MLRVDIVNAPSLFANCGRASMDLFLLHGGRRVQQLIAQHARCTRALISHDRASAGLELLEGPDPRLVSSQWQLGVCLHPWTAPRGAHDSELTCFPQTDRLQAPNSRGSAFVSRNPDLPRVLVVREKRAGNRRVGNSQRRRAAHQQIVDGRRGTPMGGVAIRSGPPGVRLTMELNRPPRKHVEE